MARDDRRPLAGRVALVTGGSLSIAISGNTNAISGIEIARRTVAICPEPSAAATSNRA